LGSLAFFGIALIRGKKALASKKNKKKGEKKKKRGGGGGEVIIDFSLPCIMKIQA